MIFPTPPIVAALFASFALGSPLEKRGSALEVTLTVTDNTKVTAQITNTGSAPLRLLNAGTLLDTSPVRKVKVLSDGYAIPFKGIKKRIRYAGLNDQAFTFIEIGEHIDVDVDLASVHSLTTSTYNIIVEGVIPYAEMSNNTLAGAIAYKSNSLKIDVNGTTAASVPKALQLKPGMSTYEQGDCNGSSNGALLDCAVLATNAANEAVSGDANRFQTYFKTTDDNVRRTVSARLNAVANECSNSPNGGVTTLHCADIYNDCTSNTLAYTVPADNVIVNCPLYFQVLPTISGGCHDQDQATTTLHEMTHAPAVFSPGTDDIAYGYNAAIGLNTDQAVDNADTYALFANAVYANC